ncbi:type 4a pilus biogenesis protein PilO [Echinimonas agarilytica]|uniref:Type 4a pilus biogenesis protein PilO n=1 Tax=Echinimonas agarilytica TaxID=1215918 RepID=A0AA42B6E3_9GAMM|nr:type 4a pilus biogenesis protein PilO [Echinimonas agarilytica]MCM2678341.1 type 4a pilus biogenesis protein PilO [Echinimonas agarilytica]
MQIDWKAELEQLKQVDLDLDNMGSWPRLVKAAFASMVAAFAAFLVYYFVISDQLTELEAERNTEVELRQAYEVKFGIAVNVEVYREQLKAIEQQFQSMLKQLPTRHETAALLDDMTFIGTANGLRFDKLEWQPEREQEIYIELPMELEVVGQYHQLGQFVSDVAGLSRIISLHDFQLKAVEDEEDMLSMHVQARTYRYKESEK